MEQSALHNRSEITRRRCNNAKICETVVRELDDIGKTLDGLSRTDLLKSCTLVQEGVDLLHVSLRKSNLEQKFLVTEWEDDCAKSSRMTTEVESEILNEAPSCRAEAKTKRG